MGCIELEFLLIRLTGALAGKRKSSCSHIVMLLEGMNNQARSPNCEPFDLGADKIGRWWCAIVRHINTVVTP